jgi:hypothetical protein
VDEGETLRRLTFVATVAAVGLNVALFLQTAISQLGPGEVTSSIVSLVKAVLPGAGGIQPPAQNLGPGSGAPPVAISRPS